MLKPTQIQSAVMTIAGMTSAGFAEPPLLEPPADKLLQGSGS